MELEMHSVPDSVVAHILTVGKKVLSGALVRVASEAEIGPDSEFLNVVKLSAPGYLLRVESLLTSTRYLR